MPPVSVTTEEKSTILSMLYPKSRAKQMNPKKKYVCAVCKSSCDLYGLFNHMKQVRNKNIILPHNFFDMRNILYTDNKEGNYRMEDTILGNTVAPILSQLYFLCN